MRRVVQLVLIALVIAACGAGRESATTTTAPPSTTTTEQSSTSTAPISTTAPESTTTAPGYDLTIEGGTADQPDITVVGPDLFSFALNDEVSITIYSSVTDELHIHGYDHFFQLEAGESVEVMFVADIPGIFEAELESDHFLLFELEVTP